MIRLPPAIRVFERGWLSSNNILLFDDGRATLIDSGYLAHAAQTVELVRGALGDVPLVEVLNTHVHSDHMGGNAALQQAFGCRVRVPEGHRDPLQAWDEDALLLEPLGQRAAPFRVDGVLRADDRLLAGGVAWQALAVPGHDMDALAFHSEELRLLIPGDALWENGFGVIFPQLLGLADGFAATRSTLDTLALLPVDLVIPGHGPPFDDFDGALQRAYGRLAALESSPERFARNALKVVLSFALLDRRRIARAALPAFLAKSSFCVRVNERYLQRDIDVLAVELSAELERAGVLYAEDGFWVAA